jgi:MFS family permease
VVLTLTFALLLADHMSRQVVAALFPQLRAEWALTDTQLGALAGVVPLVVSVLAVPLSLASDRWGRVRAIVLMGLVWSLATVGAALTTGHGELLATRLLTGVGEAAYGSVGLAVVLAVFPPDRRAALTGAFLAGASLGAVIGVAAGGAIAVRFGWRWSFVAIGVLGLVLVAAYRLLISDDRVSRFRDSAPGPERTEVPGASRAPLVTLVSPPAVVGAYLGSGLQLFVAGALIAWLPSWLDRVYHLAPNRAAGVAAVVLLVMGAGMIGCGAVSDRSARSRPVRQWTTGITWSAASLALLGAAFSRGPGPVQLLLVLAGAFFVAGTAGPAGAVVADLTPESVRATALGVLALANNLLGLAAGSFVTGVLADRLGLDGAMRVVPLVSVAAIAVLLVGRHAYPDGAAERRGTARPGGRRDRRRSSARS